MKLNETWIGRSLGRGVIILTISATVLSGCVEQIELAPGTVQANDMCGKHLVTIAEARRTEINTLAQNAAAGAIFGAILGAAVSSGNDRARGALAGAAIGGLAGFSGTYYNQKRANARDAQALLASVNQDASKEQALVTRTGAAVAELRRCRDGQAAQLVSGIKSGKVDKAQGRSQLAALKQRIATDNKVISASFIGIGQRVDSYIDATAATASVTRAQVQAGATASARTARAATPAVDSVTLSAKNMAAQDAQAASALELRIRSIETLLG